MIFFFFYFFLLLIKELFYALFQYRASLRSALAEGEVFREVLRAISSENSGEMRGAVRSENKSEVTRLTARQPAPQPNASRREARVAVRRRLIIYSHPPPSEAFLCTRIAKKPYGEQHTCDASLKFLSMQRPNHSNPRCSEISDPALEDVV